MIPDEVSGASFTLSCVSFDDNECLIGEAARDQISTNPTNTIRNAKRLIGLVVDIVKLHTILISGPSMCCGGKEKRALRSSF